MTSFGCHKWALWSGRSPVRCRDCQLSPVFRYRCSLREIPSVGALWETERGDSLNWATRWQSAVGDWTTSARRRSRYRQSLHAPAMLHSRSSLAQFTSQICCCVLPSTLFTFKSSRHFPNAEMAMLSHAAREGNRLSLSLAFPPHLLFKTDDRASSLGGWQLVPGCALQCRNQTRTNTA